MAATKINLKDQLTACPQITPKSLVRYLGSFGFSPVLSTFAASVHAEHRNRSVATSSIQMRLDVKSLAEHRRGRSFQVSCLKMIEEKIKLNLQSTHFEKSACNVKTSAVIRLKQNRGRQICIRITSVSRRPSSEITLFVDV